MDKKLYIVATPIGNLGDISFRAIETLKSVEAILCEDTRVTHNLLNHFEIKNKTLSIHQHSTEEKIAHILSQYNSLAYVSDAGTPGISDPGNKIVAKAIELGMKVEPIPGASAVIAALSVAGFSTDKFTFLGFMPMKGKTRTIQFIKNSEYTTCFYESPHRIIKTLTEMQKFLEPERQVVVARELTKMFETIYRGTLAEIIPQIMEKQKGEFAVVVKGC